VKNESTPINSEQIRQSLSFGASAVVQEIVVKAVTDSTNADAANASSDCGVFIADMQTAGRGRRGRQWISPAGANIYLSIRWCTPASAASFAGLSLAVGVAIAEALVGLGAEHLALKWPNDIVLRSGEKLGGILIEVAGEMAGPATVIVGVGLNYEMPESYAAQIGQPYANLKAHMLREHNRNRIAAELINSIVSVLAHYEEQQFAPYVEGWQRFDVLAGKPVVVHLPQGSESGIARGVSAMGELMVENRGVCKHFAGGEVTVRSEPDAC